MADNSTILEKLDGLVARFEEISTLITDPAVIADQKRYVKLTKEYKELDDLMKARKEYIQLLGNIEEAKNILANESDAEMREMAKEEMDNSQERLPVLEEEIKLMLVPADPQDSKNAILEIRGGAGGDEAAIFAGDLFRMYAKFCETKGWKMEVSNANEGTAGGFKEIVCSVTGDNVYGILKYESGVHRVQRVPATETQGRVHTSAASVAVLPEAEEFDVVINEGEIKWDTFRSGGAGGQKLSAGVYRCTRRIPVWIISPVPLPVGSVRRPIRTADVSATDGDCMNTHSRWYMLPCRLSEICMIRRPRCARERCSASWISRWKV